MHRTLLAAALLLLAALPAAALPTLLAPAGEPLPGERVAVLVHGINPDPSQLEPLAADLTARGYRVLLFRYDDRQDLDASAEELGQALGPVLDRVKPSRVAVVAHSMGGLVARRALTRGHAACLAERPEKVRLLTIASPFGGFASANFSRLDFGIGPESHHDLGTLSRFIRRPGELGRFKWHYKVETDEKGRTRADRAGERVDDDAVRLRRQRNPAIDGAAVHTWTLERGHVGVIDDGGELAPELPPILRRLFGPARGAQPGDAAEVDAVAAASGRAPCPALPLHPLRVSERGRGLEVRLQGARLARLTFPAPPAARRYATRARAAGWSVERRGPRLVLSQGLDADAQAVRETPFAWGGLERADGRERPPAAPQGPPTVDDVLDTARGIIGALGE